MFSVLTQPGTLYEEVQDTLTLAQKEQFAHIQHQFHQTIEKGHGRLEIRKHWIIDDQECLNYLDEGGKWKGLRAIGMVVAQRRIGQEVSTETRYYLLSFAIDVQRFATSVRSHWGIENCVHWVLDIAFREDESRVRVGYADHNLGGAPSPGAQSSSTRKDHQDRNQTQTSQGWLE